jgi:dihydroxyacetone kinase-like protein
VLRVDHEAQIVVRAGGPRPGKVALVSGGGSGHEPLHGGFVGLGMLDAACPGEVFTSPVPDQMLAATKAVDGGAGVVHLVKNYTGDVMNFKLAAEDAADEDIAVEHVLLDDDVAVQDSLYTAGRRGVGATVLAEKIAGASAERGDDLATVAGFARRVNERSRSFGVALSSCTRRRGQADLRPARGRDGGRHRHPRRAGPPARAARHAPQIAAEMVEASSRDLAPARRAACSRSSTAWAARRARALPALRRDRARLRERGLEPARRLVGRTSRRWRWRARR